MAAALLTIGLAVAAVVFRLFRRSKSNYRWLREPLRPPEMPA
jgi:hypothetical protein